MNHAGGTTDPAVPLQKHAGGFPGDFARCTQAAGLMGQRLKTLFPVQAPHVARISPDGERPEATHGSIRSMFQRMGGSSAFGQLTQTGETTDPVDPYKSMRASSQGISPAAAKRQA